MQPRVLGLWVVVPRGLGRAVLGIQDPGRTNSPGQRAGLQCTAGGLSSEALPHHPGDLGVAPSCANPLHILCVSGPAESVLEEHKIIQCNCGQLLQFDTEFDFCLPNGTSFQANFLTIPSLRTFLRGMGQIWNTLSMPNSLLCAMQRLHWCSAFRF